MIRVKDIVTYLEQVAPLAYQEAYDNAGLLVGQAAAPVTGVLICLDITEAVLQEAKAKACNFIIAHHPLIFQPISKLTGKNHVERCITYAIKQDLAIYGLHTNLDNVAQGVNRQIAQCLDLQSMAILLPKPDVLGKLTTFAPRSSIASVLQALHTAGADTHCSFVANGTSFQPTATENPHLGTPNELEKVEEGRIEVVFPMHLKAGLLQALQAAHPYEEVAYDIHRIENTHAKVGAGMVGVLPQSFSNDEFLNYLKAKMNLVCVRHTAPLTHPIKRVAVCGGSGSRLIPKAIAAQADVLVTADVKYHEFFQAEGQILIADIGHYESEVGTKALIYTLLSEKFTSIALLQCETVTNPIHYS